MDRDSRTIILALAAVLGAAALALIAALFIPFKVGKSATVLNATGDIALVNPDHAPIPLKTSEGETMVLKAGQGLRLQPGSTAAVSFDLMEGRALLNGPASITLRDSYRRATLLGHTFNSSRFSRKYVLTIEQSSGTVHYNFAHTDPPLGEVELTLHLPDGNYTPTLATPCWIVTISGEGTSNVQTVDCSS